MRWSGGCALVERLRCVICGHIVTPGGAAVIQQHVQTLGRKMLFLDIVLQSYTCTRAQQVDSSPEETHFSVVINPYVFACTTLYFY